MSVPYLNRGESIVLTTHRVSMDSVLYDAMLTNERLILMDSINDRVEPRILSFHSIITVKGGSASTGDPAIILTLEEPNNFTGSGTTSLIFTRNPGEKRKHECELWVKELIQLVIRAREREAQKEVAPAGRKTGMQPSVRRWEAPEPVRPHSSVTGPVAPAPEPVVIIEQEPDSLEFFLEAKTPADGKTPPVAAKQGTADKPPAPAKSVPKAGPVTTPLHKKRNKPAPVQPVVKPEPEVPPIKEIAPKDLFAGIHITPPPPEPEKQPEPSRSQPEPVRTYGSTESFENIVQTAAGSLLVEKEPETIPVPEIPAAPCTREPGMTAAKDTREPEPVQSREPVIQRTTPLPDIHAAGNSVTPPLPVTPGEKRELPGTYTPEIPVPVISPRTDDKKPGRTGPGQESGERPVPKRMPVAVIAAIILVALFAIIGAAFLATMYFQDSPYGNTVVTIAPSAPVTQEPNIVPADTTPAGVQVRVNYPHSFTGTIGNPGFSRPVSGTGNRVFPVLMTNTIVQATVQKQDYSADMLTIEIYNNRTLLASKSVTAPMGEVSLLIDTTTAAAPGMSTVTTPADGRPLLGNGSLIYY